MTEDGIGSGGRVGVDVGGTKIAAALVDAAGRVRARTAVPTPLDRGSEGVLDAIEAAVLRVDPHRGATGIGVGTGGVVDASTGTVLSATDLLPDWAGTPVGPYLAERSGRPVSVDNDVNALAVGELVFCAPAGPRGPDGPVPSGPATDGPVPGGPGGGTWRGTMLFVAVGTGIGGALVVAGALRHGPHHTAGGVGHLPVGGDRRCSCGRRGHLESAASGPAITAAYREAAGDPGVEDLREVVRRAAADDTVALAVVERAAGTLGRSLAGVANVLDPDDVVLGGGVAQIGEALWAPLRDAFRSELLPPLRGVRLRPARLGPDASVIGAAALAFARRTGPGDPVGGAVPVAAEPARRQDSAAGTGQRGCSGGAAQEGARGAGTGPVDAGRRRTSGERQGRQSPRDSGENGRQR